MDEFHDITADIAAAARSRGLTVAAAESITAGQVATALAAAGDASEWFGASIVEHALRHLQDAALAVVGGPR